MPFPAAVRRTFAALSAVAVLSWFVPATADMAFAGGANPDPASAGGRGDRSRGMVWTGLERGGPDGCVGAWRVDVPGPTQVCTHGPDPAPAGVDVQRPLDVAELNETTGGAEASTSGAGVPCYGDGVSGNRVQAIYVHAADVADRYETVAPMIKQWAAAVDSVFADSAAETGGVRHVRWVTDANCELSVARVEVPTYGDDTYGSTGGSLQQQGFNRTDRKYLVWVDANVYCGIAGFIQDDRAGARNGNNSGPSYARVDSGCWGLMHPVEAHELMHTMGGVQSSAPHATGGGHCTDDYDRMCYQDGFGVEMTYPCATTHERLFDCGHDDYFSTNPLQGNYLANHWNAASSAFLESAVPSGSTPPVPPGGAATTTTWSGALSRKTPTKTYRLSMGDGPLVAALSFSSTSSLTISLRTAAGSIVAETAGPSVLKLTSTVAAGTYDLVVSGSQSNVRFDLRVDYTAR